MTLNPCLDKTLTVPAWEPGQSIRGRSVGEVVGGKGNNVARALRRLGWNDVRPATFLGGPIGGLCEDLLRSADGFNPLIIHSEAPTRTILTIRTEGSSDQTAFFDPDPAITPAEADAMRNRVEQALSGGDVEAIALSGSSPSPSTHALFSDLIGLANTRDVPAFLDTYGPSLRAIREHWPEAIQLNRREAGIYLDTKATTDAEMLDLLLRWSQEGVKMAIVTDGPGPVLSCLSGTVYRAFPPRIEPVNPIGSGDSMLAGLIDARLKNLDPEATLKHAVACGIANAMVWEAGAIDPEAVESYERRVHVEPA